MFRIDSLCHVPVYEQLIRQVENYVLTGILREGDKLPSVRTLAGSLAINPKNKRKTMDLLKGSVRLPVLFMI